MVSINKDFFPQRRIKIKSTIYIIELRTDELHIAAHCHTIMTGIPIERYYFWNLLFACYETSKCAVKQGCVVQLWRQNWQEVRQQWLHFCCCTWFPFTQNRVCSFCLKACNAELGYHGEDHFHSCVFKLSHKIACETLLNWYVVCQMSPFFYLHWINVAFIHIENQI